MKSIHHINKKPSQMKSRIKTDEIKDNLKGVGNEETQYDTENYPRKIRK
jgi:hypothetical protein